MFVDDYSRLARVYTMKTKDEAGTYQKKIFRSARNLLIKDEKVCYIRSDQGKEFMWGKALEVIEKKV